MLSIVHEFEAEQSTDSDDVKRQRFERVLDIMQQMQSLGHPPKELIGELVGLWTGCLHVYASSRQRNDEIVGCKCGYFYTGWVIVSFERIQAVPGTYMEVGSAKFPLQVKNTEKKWVG